MAAAAKGRLSNKGFNADECQAALRGQSIPFDLGNDVALLCTIRGIRHHMSLAASPEIMDLARGTENSLFARARNARLIMSDELPSTDDMPDRKSQPYCIWYPDVPSEDTCRKLATEFPEMRYQVGRACAVGGYQRLYRELDLLPDICIAEEARENRDSPGAQDIYSLIMAAPTRYAVMNDYRRNIELDAPRSGAFLNADTALRKTLDVRKKFSKKFVPWRQFNITEDWSIDEDDHQAEPAVLDGNEIELFSSPLPRDLPTSNKDLLILKAAYEGNVDRYARLRRPRPIQAEANCLIRGIYHSTSMALWLQRSDDVVKALNLGTRHEKILRRAINARFVMNNSIGRIVKGDVPDDELPYWIWYPTTPSTYTLITLAQQKATMRPQCARACIALGCRNEYKTIMDMSDPVKPNSTLAVDPFLLHEARSCKDKDYFEADLQQRQEKQGSVPNSFEENWKLYTPWKDGDPSSTELKARLQDCSLEVFDGQEGGMYEDIHADMGPVLLHLSSTEAERERASEAEYGYVFLEG